jgi:hypothetical protein
MKKVISHTDFMRAIEELEKIPFDEKAQNLRAEYLDMRSTSEKEAEEDINSIFVSALEKDIRSLDTVPSPLTKEESAAFDSKYTETAEDLKELFQKVEKAKIAIDKQIKDIEGGFTVDLKGSPRVRRACKKIFGDRKRYISYDDYLKAREIRDSFTSEEGESMFRDEE